MISLIVTSYESPETTRECIERLLNQKDFNEEFELIVACPDEPTKRVIMDFKKKFPKIIKYVYQDYSWPKNKLMNDILKIVKGRILIWTDGNKLFEKDVVKLLLEPFTDEKVGITGGRIIPENNKDSLFGSWANLLAEGLHKVRERRFSKNDFIEHTPNIFAMRNGIIKKIPLDVAEGSIISFLISHKGYKSIYVKDAKVYVTYPDTLYKSFLQRARSAKAHMELLKYIKNSQIKYKNFYNEILFFTIKNTFKQSFRSLSFILFLAFVQLRAYFSLRIRKQHYISLWKVQSSP